MTLIFYSFFQSPGYFRFKNSFLIIREIVIANSKDSNLNLDCDIGILRYLPRKYDVSPDFLLQKIEDEIKELIQDHTRESKFHLALKKKLSKDSIRISQREIDSMYGLSPALE